MPWEAQTQVLLLIFLLCYLYAKSLQTRLQNLPTASPMSLPLRLSLGSCCSWAGLALPPWTCMAAPGVSSSLWDQPPVPLHLAVTQHFSLTGN